MNSLQQERLLYLGRNNMINKGFIEEIQTRSMMALMRQLPTGSYSEIEAQIRIASGKGETAVIVQVSDKYQQYITKLVKLFKLQGFEIFAQVPETNRRTVNGAYAKELYINWEV